MATPRKTTAAKKAPAKKAAAKRPARKPATKKTTARKTASSTPRALGRAGTSQRATWDELTKLGLVDTAHGRTALVMAKWVDMADTPQGAGAAARELRMQMHVVRSVGNKLSPPVPDEDLDDNPDGSDDGTISLAEMRARQDAQRSG